MAGKGLSKVAVIGAGERGFGFGGLIADLPHLGQVAGVAEPDAGRREAFAKAYGLDASMAFEGWKQLLAAPKRCDAVVIATMDRDHVEPAVACLEAGYDLLLEKPMAITLADCRAIEAAQRKSGRIVAVCHSLRYQAGFTKVRMLLEGGAIGRLLSIEHLEQVAYWHYALSYVRGNWRREADSCFMLMAKSCHDIDYIASLVKGKALRVASAGSLTHFRKENAPQGSTDFCTGGCAVEASCPYSAVKWYVNADREEWPANVVSLDHSREAHLKAVQTGTYGRCVWRHENDVVDHQVVMMEFEGGVTANFTMSLANDMGRRVTLHGSEGEIYFEESENLITVKRFGVGIEKIRLQHESGGHGGGDARVIRNWLEALQKGDASLIRTNAQESLRTHTLTFAAEKARREKRMVELSEMG